MNTTSILTRVALLACMGMPALSQAALLALPVNEPIIDGGSGGVIAYDAASGVVTISGTPQLLNNSDPFLFGEIMNTMAGDERAISIMFKVAPDGSLVDGVDGPDLVITGSVDIDFDGVPDYDGVLLEAEVSQFGFQDGGSAGDQFDIRLNTVTGQLAPLFGDNDLVVTVASELAADYPNPFKGSFSTDFLALAKTSLGSTDAPVITPQDACKVSVESFCAVDGGKQQTVCRIQTGKSVKHWERKWHYQGGHQYCKSHYGTHGHAVPFWMPRDKETPVTFTYVVTNTGTVPIQNLQLVDSFDEDLAGVPASLAPGQVVTIRSVENLNEALTNVVMVSGDGAGGSCSSSDSVDIKDKPKPSKGKDVDWFKDKSDWKRLFKWHR